MQYLYTAWLHIRTLCSYHVCIELHKAAQVARDGKRQHVQASSTEPLQQTLTESLNHEVDCNKIRLGEIHLHTQPQSVP